MRRRATRSLTEEVALGCLDYMRALSRCQARSGLLICRAVRRCWRVFASRDLPREAIRLTAWRSCEASDLGGGLAHARATCEQGLQMLDGAPLPRFRCFLLDSWRRAVDDEGELAAWRFVTIIA